MVNEFVPDDTRLFRRLPPVWVVEDVKRAEGFRPSSQAFQNNTKPVKTNSMSIYLEDTLDSLGRTPASVVAGSDFLLVALKAGFVRAQDHQEVERTPTSEEPAHGDVVGDKPSRVKDSFAREAEWTVPPSVGIA